MHLYEHSSKPLLPFAAYLRRVCRSVWLAFIVAGSALALGTVGYHLIAGLRWVDAFLEAAMILSGMGAIAPMTTDAAKIFAALYALCSGLVVLSVTGIILAPWVHRLLHHFHLDTQSRHQ